MQKSKLRVFVAVLTLSLISIGPASAWEFRMDGAFSLEYDLLGQTGPRGFLGPYDIDHGVTTLGRAASLNGWLGQRMGDMVSGSDANQQIQYFLANMELVVNPAIRLRGTYILGQWAPTGFADGTALGNTVTSQYINSLHPGTQRSFSPGYWNCFWSTVQLPIGTLSFGKRPFIFGTGLAWMVKKTEVTKILHL